MIENDLFGNQEFTFDIGCVLSPTNKVFNIEVDKMKCCHSNIAEPTSKSKRPPKQKKRRKLSSAAKLRWKKTRLKIRRKKRQFPEYVKKEKLRFKKWYDKTPNYNHNFRFRKSVKDKNPKP